MKCKPTAQSPKCSFLYCNLFSLNFFILFPNAKRMKGRYKNRRTGGHISFGIVFVCAHNLTNRICTQLHLPEQICSPNVLVSFLFLFYFALIVLLLEIASCQYCCCCWLFYLFCAFNSPRINT